MPTQQSYGARELSKPDPTVKAQISRKLQMAGLKLSHRGLNQVLEAQLVSDAADRQELARLVSKVANSKLGSWAKVTGLDVTWDVD